MSGVTLVPVLTGLAAAVGIVATMLLHWWVAAALIAIGGSVVIIRSINGLLTWRRHD